jgi:CheY-like chemotaxis protein
VKPAEETARFHVRRVICFEGRVVQGAIVMPDGRAQYAVAPGIFGESEYLVGRSAQGPLPMGYSTVTGAFSRPGCAGRGDEVMTLSFFVVDDEPDIVDLFQQRFRREVRNGECRLHFAQSGEEALRLIKEGVSPEPILILTDINMPGMDGLELLERVKQHRPELHVVMVTAYGDAERRRLAAERGATGYLVKPIDFGALKTLIKEIGANAVPLPPRPGRPPGDTGE